MTDHNNRPARQHHVSQSGPPSPPAFAAEVARSLGFAVRYVSYVGGVPQLASDVPAAVLPWVVEIPASDSAQSRTAVLVVLDEPTAGSAVPTGTRLDFLPLGAVLEGPWWDDERGFVHIGKRPADD
ncbi:hypothetical protein [Murinocardiopsis flavida]|nr:hypothetical protein [Murinocardiopsis flavida]